MIVAEEEEDMMFGLLRMLLVPTKVVQLGWIGLKESEMISEQEEDLVKKITKIEDEERCSWIRRRSSEGCKGCKERHRKN